ncbi:abortive infection family protein [Nitratireductor aquimarinus]|uniref:abortive infection family protein n=1 Tax=Nitratireductor aquimarinus TaxID=889300 RepID=UPI002936833E|nr:abortive infection family protein [Nitratireductor aquimarinus]MDV2966788.1 abortive infection family protein [Nitratireductor aquimarinus]
MRLRSIITAHGTGGALDDAEFQLLRSEFLYDPNTRNLLPKFVRDNLNGDGVWAYLKDFHTGSGAYAARRKHVAAQFEPILDFLSKNGAPADAEVTASLDRYDEEGVSNAWQKALNRRKADPEGAITAARTLLEEVCKHILEDAGETPNEKWDLPKLYSAASNNMNLAPSQHTEDVFKRILGGCQNVVENLGGLRNKISDAHGGGRRRVKPSDRHAALAVNLAGSMAQFLIETWIIQRERVNSNEAKSEEKHKPVTYKKVLLSSRYDLASEIRNMKRIVDSLAPDMARRIDSIWCDSKASTVYTVTVHRGMWTPELLWAVADAGYETGGYNGFYFEGDAPENTTLAPDWPGDIA